MTSLPCQICLTSTRIPTQQQFVDEHFKPKEQWENKLVFFTGTYSAGFRNALHDYTRPLASKGFGRSGIDDIWKDRLDSAKRSLLPTGQLPEEYPKCAAQAMAKQAKGTVHVLLTPDADQTGYPGTIWRDFELPALQKNNIRILRVNVTQREGVMKYLPRIAPAIFSKYKYSSPIEFAPFNVV
ncbi:hypothetical protein C8J56DRAFT_920259 [Mycena floridula]|nr:hypothetical protein C8J56DRAFT_920259 [Mycena floridula]